MQHELCAPEGLLRAEQLEYWRTLAQELFNALNDAIGSFERHGTLSDSVVKTSCETLAKALGET